jgi:trehalose-6-phosphate synthase
VADTPRWESAEFRDTRVSRPQEGLIVIAYRVAARRGEQSYHALCTSTLRRLAHEEWDVVQHQQTPLGVIVADPEAG